MHAAHAHASHAGYAAQPFLQAVHVVVQFAVGLVVAFHRYEQRRGVSEVIHHPKCEHARRQFRLEHRHTVLELAPELVLVIQIVVKLHLDIHDSVARLRYGLILAHLLVSEYIVLQRFGNLFHHLVGRQSRCDCNYHSLTYGEVGKFVLPHARQAIYAQCYQAAHHQNYYLMIMHGPFHHAPFLLFCFHITIGLYVQKVTGVPLHTLAWPSTMILSPALSPDSISTPSAL